MAGLQFLRIAALAACSASALQNQIPIQIPAPPTRDSASSYTKKHLVDTKALQATIKSENLLARAEKLFKIAELSHDEYNHPTRVIGSIGHTETLSWIYSTIAELGDYYTISNQSFPAVTGNIFEYRLVLGNEVPKSARAMGLTPPTKNKEPVHGDVVLVANEGCDRSDYPTNLTNAIALIKRGTCPFGTKSELAGKSGAIAAIVYNNEKGSVSGTLGTPSPYHIATFGISQEDALPFIDELNNGTSVDAIAYMDAEVNSISTTNIIAQTVAGDPENCVMLGAHSDSVTEGPGINDDGSGTMTLLEIATQLTNFTVNNCVRFAWWAGEEEGLLGSDYYVSVLPSVENKKIRMFMDYDMLASPNYAYQIYNATNAVNPVGSEELRDLYIDWYKSEGLNYTFIPFDGRSDYDGFIRGGIPGGGIATGAEGIKTKEEVAMFGGKAGDWYDPCYHQLCDNIGNLNMTAWVLNTKVGLHFRAATVGSSIHACQEIPRLIHHSQLDIDIAIFLALFLLE
jgi:aminopeptidase Y